MRKIVDAKRITPAQLALAWLLAQVPWIVPLPATTKLHRLDEKLAAADEVLTAAELHTIRESLAAITVHGDRYNAALQALIDR